MGPGLPKHPRVEPRAGSGPDPSLGSILIRRCGLQLFYMAWLGTSLKIVGQIWGLNFGKEEGWTPIIRSVIFDISLELFQGMYHFSMRYKRVGHTLAAMVFF